MLNHCQTGTEVSTLSRMAMEMCDVSLVGVGNFLILWVRLDSAVLMITHRCENWV